MFAFEDVHWYYIDDAKNDAQIGPFVISQLKELFEQGVVKTDTYCWHEELDNWALLSVIHFKGKPAISYLEKSSDPKVEILKPPPVKLTMKDELALRVKARQEKLEKISDVSSNPSESHIPSHLSSNPSFVHLQSPALETSFQTPSSVKPDLPQKLETKQDKTDFSDSGSDFSSQQSLVIEVPRPRGMTFEEELKSRLKKKFGK